MNKKIALLVVLIFTFCTSNSFSQNFWNNTSKKVSSFQKNEILARDNNPDKYALASLNLDGFKNHLVNLKSKSSKNIITLPNSKGELKRFSIVETSYLAPRLAAKFPMIKSYSAKGIDDPTAVAKISIGTNGFHALIHSGKESTIYIDPFTKDQKQYLVYKREDLTATKNDFSCEIKTSANKIVASTNLKRNANDGKLRTFRIAIAATGEYSQFHINRASSTPTNDTERKAIVLSAMNVTITRVNAVYENDLAVRMVIVNDNDKLIFLDAATDDLSNNDANSLIDESQQKCDDIIGNANYDIGHTFSTGGGGLAQLGSVCVTGSKASGITGSGQPTNDPFDIDYVAHELGHQFGATHTFNGTAGNCGGNIGATSVEPGSGTTIMAYAGICSPQNVQNNSDDYFHAVSIAQMWAHVQNRGDCAAQTDTNNDAPIANAGNNVSIPKSTPFILKATATDAQGLASLTYNWEQIDTESASIPLESTSTAGPAFRSLPSSSSPNRYLPTLTNVVNGGSDEWIVLPSVARELNFALTVRDNNTGGGSSDRDDLTVTVTDAEAFTVTAPNTSVTWGIGSSQTVTWNKGTSDQAPINCSNVNIRLSTDGGVTFPILLKENIVNDGTEDITIPNNPTTTARILVEAADNIFYNVNATNFTIIETGPTFIVSNETNQQTVCNVGDNTVEYTLNFQFINGFSETVNLSAIDLPTDANVAFSPTTIDANGNVVMTISNLDGTAQQDYTVVVNAESDSVSQTANAALKVIGTDFSTISLTNPANTATNISVSPSFEWVADANATSYNIEVATDAGFTTTVINETVTTNTYIPSTPLSGVTKYYWRVKPINECGEGANSATNEFTTETPSYCTSSFTDEANGAEHITNVTFNSINNNSGNDTVDGYEDFTSISTTIKRTQSHQVNVTFNTAGYQDHCYVFIDWNQDYKFDNATERYDLGNKLEDVATAALNIRVPDDAVLGETRMRVIIEYFESSAPNGEGACDADHTSEWGETEDYTIIVEEEPQPDFTLTNTTGNLSICNQAINEQSFTFDFKTLFGFNENVSFSVTGIPTGATSSFSPTTVNTSGAIDLTLSNLNNAVIGDYIMIVTATSASVTKSIDINFNVNDTICKSEGTTSSLIGTTLVNFAGINNSSAKTAGYSDFKSIATEVITGNTYNLAVNANSDGNNTTKTFAWIDWNQNCLFDAGEQYDLGTVTNANTATSNSGLAITIPTDALAGSTTLRITTKLVDEGDPNSCELSFNGEVEDYTITITPDFTIENTTGGGSICNKATNEFIYIIDYKTFNNFNETVTFTTSDLPANASATLSTATVNSNSTVTVTVTNLNNVEKGDYAFKLTGTSSITKSIDIVLNVNDDLCKSSGNTVSQISITNVTFGEIDNTSTKTSGYSDFKSIATGVVRGESYDINTTINSDGNSDIKTYAWIDWNQNCLFDADEAYDITSNREAISVPDNALIGTTTLRVSTKLNEFARSCELDFNGEVEDYTINVEENFATDKSLFTDLNLYPIPSEGTITVDFKVKVKELTVVRLFDFAGNLLDTQSFSTISSKFNEEIQFPKVSSGIYLLQVQNDGKLTTRKIIIK
mgnify:CR=1 FL=1